MFHTGDIVDHFSQPYQGENADPQYQRFERIAGVIRADAARQAAESFQRSQIHVALGLERQFPALDS